MTKIFNLIELIPHNKPTLGKEEEEAVLRVIRSNQLSQEKEVELFENEFCEFIGLPKEHAVAVSSGTAALYLSLWVLNSSGQIIAFPSYVCSAVRNAIGMVGGKEYFVDNKKDSPNLNFDAIKNESVDIAIIPHMFGIPSEIKNHNKLKIIEDCAQSLGAKINEKYVGTVGDVGIFSFYATKLMTTSGQGGMFVSKNKDLVDKVRDYREFDYRRDKKLRFNFQMTEIQAAVGRAQLKKLPSFLKRREEIFQKYKKSGIDLLDTDPTNSKIKPVRYRAIMITDEQSKIIAKLKSENISGMIPIEEWELLNQDDNLLPNAIEFSKKTISLPIYPSLTNDDIELIISCVTKK